MVLGLPVLCWIACLPSAQRVVAQRFFQCRGQRAGGSEVLRGNGGRGRDGNGGGVRCTQGEEEALRRPDESRTGGADTLEGGLEGGG